MHRSADPLAVTLTLLFLAACGDGGGGGGATTTTGTGGAGASGGGGADGGGGAGGQSDTCHGDATAWETITMAPIACQANSDCCVVMNSCLNAGQIVHASDYASAPGAWRYCDSECNNCIPPAVKIECVNNACVGYDASDEEPPDSPLRQNHCGTDGALMLPEPKMTFGCG